MFHSSGGDILTDDGAVVPIDAAEDYVRDWRTKAQTFPGGILATVYDGLARDLNAAVEQARDWKRAANAI